MSDALLTLVNAPITINFDGKDYQVSKASLKKVALYQERLRKMSDEGKRNIDSELVAYAIFLILDGTVPDLTEEKVLETVQGDIDVYDTLVGLGFVNPTKAKALLKLMQEAKNQTTPDSSQPSPSAPDGLPTKSES